MKIIVIICVVAWLCVAVGFGVSEGLSWESNVFGSIAYVGFYVAFVSTPILIIMALINYARRK